MLVRRASSAPAPAASIRKLVSDELDDERARLRGGILSSLVAELLARADAQRQGFFVFGRTARLYATVSMYF